MKIKRKAPDTGRKGIYASARTGEPNPPEGHLGYATEAKLLGLRLTEGSMPDKKDINAAISFLSAVTPGCKQTAELESEHLMVLCTAVSALEREGKPVDNITKEFLLAWARGGEHPETGWNIFRERMKALFNP